MDKAIKLPQVRTGKDRTVAEIAVFVLSQRWPLPLKSLHHKVNRVRGKSASFQATHKALNKLVGQNILKWDGKLYKLNTEWLGQLEKFCAETKQAYLEIESPNEIGEAAK